MAKQEIPQDLIYELNRKMASERRVEWRDEIIDKLALMSTADVATWLENELELLTERSLFVKRMIKKLKITKSSDTDKVSDIDETRGQSETC